MQKTILIAVALVAVAAAGAWYVTTSKDSAVFVAEVAYACDAGKSIRASYYENGQPQEVAPGEPPVPTGRVELVLSDGTRMALSQTLSASGVRYANADESFVFWNKGEEALVMRNNTMDLAYTNCRTAAEAACPAGEARVGEGCMPLKDECELRGDTYHFDEAQQTCLNHAE